jgi:hypothetical protein
MTNILRHIITYLAVVLIVAATGGIGLVQHYCSCENDSHLSISAVSPAPSPDEEAGSCCEAEPSVVTETCCSSSSGHHGDMNGHQCHAGEGCCSEHYSFIKTDQFNLVSSPVDLLKYFSGPATELSSSIEEDPIATNLATPVSDRSPPGNYGRLLLIRIHQLKTVPLIS